MNLIEAEEVARYFVGKGYPARTYPNPSQPGRHRVLVGGGKRHYWVTSATELPTALADLEQGILTNKQLTEGETDGEPARDLPLPRLPN